MLLYVGLPTQIRDQALPNAVKMPESEANREFFMDQAETMVIPTSNNYLESIS